MGLTSAAAGKDLAKEVIFPAVFNYWKDLGLAFSTEEEETRKAVCRKLVSE